MLHYQILSMICFLICVILLYKVVGIKRTLQAITRQLEGASKTSVNQLITISFVDRDVEAVAAKVNCLIANYNKKMDEIRVNEQKLKCQISDISHDLRTPLTSIVGYLQLLNTEGITEKQKSDYIWIIRDKAQYLNELINSFFELSVIDSEGCLMKFETFDLTDKVNNVILSNYSLIKIKGIEPVIDILPNSIYIESDVMICERIIQNLLVNALKYTKGTVYMTLREDSNGRPEFCVRNESDAIAEEDLKNLCDRFYKMDRARTSSCTGLGLYIAKVLIEKIGGSIKLSYMEGFFCVKVIFGK